MKKILLMAALAAMVFLLPSGGGYALADGTWHIETVDSGGDVGTDTSIALDSSDNPHISYFDDTNDDLKYAYYDSTWHTEVVDSGGSVGASTSIALDSSDNPHISYWDFTNLDLKYAYYDGTWHIEIVDSSGYMGRYTSIALDSSDNPHISYLDGTNDDLKYAYYDSTWHIETVDSTGQVGTWTSIALDSNDNPHISYHHWGDEDLKYAYYDGTWHTEIVDSSGYMGLQTSIALDSSDNPHISYLDGTNDDLKYAYYDSSWHIEIVDSGGDVGVLTSIALDSSDNPHISYYDYTNEDLKYAYYDSSWHTETVDSSGQVGTWTSIALDSSDNPHISYYDRTNEDLKYAYAARDIAVTNVTPSQTVVAQGYPASIDVTVENQGDFTTETFDVTTYYNGTVRNGDFEKDPTGTSLNDISDWNYQTVVHMGNPATGDDLQIVDDYYFKGAKSVYSYLQTTSVPPFPGDSYVSQYLSTEEPVSTTADHITLWIGGDGYTTSSRYSWRIALILTDGTNTYEEIVRCDCWGLNEGCTPNHYDYYDATQTGADGNTWKRYTRSIPDSIDKSNLTIKIRHYQASWDLTQASSWYRLDSIYFSDPEGNPHGLIETKTVTNLPPASGTTVTFTWDTTGVALGDYIISAHAHPVPGETDTADNTYIDGIVTITAPPTPVGGIAQLPDASGSSGRSYIALAALAAALVALTAGGWYARRRLLR